MVSLNFNCNKMSIAAIDESFFDKLIFIRSLSAEKGKLVFTRSHKTNETFDCLMWKIDIRLLDVEQLSTIVKIYHLILNRFLVSDS